MRRRNLIGRKPNCAPVQKIVDTKHRTRPFFFFLFSTYSLCTFFSNEMPSIDNLAACLLYHSLCQPIMRQFLRIVLHWTAALLVVWPFSIRSQKLMRSLRIYFWGSRKDKFIAHEPKAVKGPIFQVKQKFVWRLCLLKTSFIFNVCLVGVVATSGYPTRQSSIQA